jgi:SAM-dependent methyltransferase
VSRQNIYDDEAFFARYQQLRGSESGINAAVEQPALRALLPDVTGRTVLDLGCGDGGLARDLAARGAVRVLGADPSLRMLALARDRTADPPVRYVQAFAEDLALRDGRVDLVVSSLAFHYVADLGAVLDRVARWLRPGGGLVASMEHPMCTAELERLDDPAVAGRYDIEGRRDQSWFIDGVVKYHRRLSTILGLILAAGLELRTVTEPGPTPQALAARPELDRHLRQPPILVLAATKPEPGAARLSFWAEDHESEGGARDSGDGGDRQRRRRGGAGAGGGPSGPGDDPRSVRGPAAGRCDGGPGRPDRAGHPGRRVRRRERGVPAGRVPGSAGAAGPDGRRRGAPGGAAVHRRRGRRQPGQLRGPVQRGLRGRRP